MWCTRLRTSCILTSSHCRLLNFQSTYFIRGRPYAHIWACSATIYMRYDWVYYVHPLVCLLINYAFSFISTCHFATDDLWYFNSLCLCVWNRAALGMTVLVPRVLVLRLYYILFIESHSSFSLPPLYIFIKSHKTVSPSVWVGWERPTLCLIVIFTSIYVMLHFGTFLCRYSEFWSEWFKFDTFGLWHWFQCSRRSLSISTARHTKVRHSSGWSYGRGLMM